MKYDWTCDNPYCCYNPRRNRNTYESVTGEICARCEDKQNEIDEEEERENPACPWCSERKDDHDMPFPCPEEHNGG